MRGNYGSVHRVSNFIQRTIPNRDSTSDLFAFRVIQFLQELDKLQRENSYLDLTIHTNDGIWISHGGLRFAFVKPGQRELTLMSGSWSDLARRVIRLASAKTNQFESSTATEDYRTWKMGSKGMNALLAFVAKLRKPSAAIALNSRLHPRNFPPDLRDVVLRGFERGGSVCPGVRPLGRPKHKLDLKRERIEYDHILPHSRGGAASIHNIQILCQECNRAKGARPI